MPTTHSTSSTTRAGTPARLNAIDWLALVLVIVGGLNWACVGALGVDLVAAIFGPMSLLSRVVYVLVGLGAIYLIVVAARLRHDTGTMAA